MYEHLGVIAKKEQTGASIFVDNKGKETRIFGGQIGDVVVRDSKSGTAVILKSSDWETYQNEHKKPKKEKIEETQNV